MTQRIKIEEEDNGTVRLVSRSQTHPLLDQKGEGFGYVRLQSDLIIPTMFVPLVSVGLPCKLVLHVPLSDY